jgi:beta-fructofuranosidase
MFYTGGNYAEQGLIQRIGLATSVDLLKWQKHPANPLIEVDPHWYETLDLELWHEQAWRDPWVFLHPETGDFHAYITARVNYGPTDERGVIAHAHSENLLDWKVLPPVTKPGNFGMLEVPQLVKINKRYYLFFCTTDWAHSSQWKSRTGRKPVTGPRYFVAADYLGPFHLSNTEKFLVGDEIGSLYSGKIIRNPKGEWVYLAFRDFEYENRFIGEISNALPLNVLSDGRLTITVT